VATLYVIFLALLIFAGLWTGMQMLVSRVGGWFFLTAAYRTAKQFRGRVWKAEDCRLVGMNWQGFEPSLETCFPLLPLDLPDDVAATSSEDLKLGANEQGLYLRPSWLSVRPPLFMSWDDIAVAQLRAPLKDYLGGTRLGLSESGRGAAPALCVDRLTFRFRRAPLVVLQVTARDGDRIAVAAGRSWPGIDPLPASLLSRE
jgi:hypothetical protein